MEGQADGRRQRSRKPPSDEPWRSAPALRLLPPLRAADVLTDIRLRSPSGRARPPPSAIQSHAWRASPISDGTWLLTRDLGHPGICRCKSCALRHLHRLDLRRYLRAAGRATREGRVPHGGLGRSRSFSTDVADWVGAGFQNQSRRVRFLSSVPSSRCPTATMPPCHGGDAGSTPAAGSISRGRLTEGCRSTEPATMVRIHPSRPTVVVAQSEEHRPPKPEVGGSSPPRDAMPQQLNRTSIPVLTGRVPVRSRPAVPSAVAARLDERRASTPTVGGSSPPCGAIPSIPSTPEESCSSASPSPAASVPATSVASGPMPPGTGARSCATGQPMAPSAAPAAYAGRPNRRPRVSARSYKPSKP